MDDDTVIHNSETAGIGCGAHDDGLVLGGLGGDELGVRYLHEVADDGFGCWSREVAEVGHIVAGVLFYADDGVVLYDDCANFLVDALFQHCLGRGREHGCCCEDDKENFLHGIIFLNE